LIPWVIFGDASFLSTHKDALEDYVAKGGQVVTNSSRFRKLSVVPPEWLYVMRKETKGLHSDRLGWNANTGASAINLALLFGASTVYLLGYDMQPMKDGRSNYHNAYNRTANPKAYARFMKGMDQVAKDLPEVFPGKRVINLEDGTSALKAFPKESLREHFASVTVGGTHG
jgi:hypothetical protein